jgi:hypothetical protein
MQAEMATALTTLANVKDWLKITDGSADATINRMITAFSNAVANYLNRDLAAQSYTETYNGGGNATLMLRNYPVTAVASVNVDGAPIAAQPAFGQDGYSFSQNAVRLVGSVFNLGFQNVQVTYTAGYTAIPPDIEQAVIEWIADRYQSMNRIGVNSRTLAGESISYSLKDIPDAVELALKPYRKVFPL